MFLEIPIKNVVMRFLVGVLCLTFGLGLIIFSVLFFDFSNLIEKLCASVAFIVSTILILIGIDSFNTFFDYKRIMNRGLKAKARIVEINRTLIAVKHMPKYILEVLYEHPKNHQLYTTFVDFYGVENKRLEFETNEYIDVLIDPKNPDIALYTS